MDQSTDMILITHQVIFFTYIYFLKLFFQCLHFLLFIIANLTQWLVMGGNVIFLEDKRWKDLIYLNEKKHVLFKYKNY